MSDQTKGLQLLYQLSVVATVPLASPIQILIIMDFFENSQRGFVGACATFEKGENMWHLRPWLTSGFLFAP
jgi:hypothetical protein